VNQDSDPANLPLHIWYLLPDEDNNDGLHTGYVDKPEYIECDKLLCESLRKVIMSGRRSVKTLERHVLLQEDPIYFSQRLDFHQRFPFQTGKDKNNREVERKKWLGAARQSIAICNAVFIDPDNGLEINSVPKINQLKSGKYAYFNEISELIKGKHACVIYHHLNRHKNHGTHAKQIESRVAELRKKVVVDSPSKIFAVSFRPYSPRAFFIVRPAGRVGRKPYRISYGG